eukprot:COSAG04_NODE_4582_length_2005_cov_1.209339_1_plen_182_part_10
MRPQAHSCVTTFFQGQFAIGLIDTSDKDAADAAAAATGAAAIEAMRQAAGADASLCLMEYSDGFRAALLHGAGAGSLLGGWAFAATVGGETVGTACTAPFRLWHRRTPLTQTVATDNGNEAPNYPPFSESPDDFLAPHCRTHQPPADLLTTGYLGLNIQQMFLEKKAPCAPLDPSSSPLSLS